MEEKLEAAKIIVADDHPLFRDALQQAIEGLPDQCDIKTAADFNKTLEMLSEDPDIDLVLLDLSMPGSSGFSGLVSLRAEYPSVPVAIVTATEDNATIRRSLDLGAAGFIPKSATMDQMRQGIVSILQGNVWIPDGVDLDGEEDPEFTGLVQRMQSLTPQQNRVLGMLGEGLLNKQIAYELGVSEATVKAHVSAVLLKLGVDSRTQAVIMMTKVGMAPSSPSASET